MQKELNTLDAEAETKDIWKDNTIATFDQLGTTITTFSAYLATRGMTEGYLVTFDFSKDKHDAEPQWIDWNGKRIFEVIV